MIEQRVTLRYGAQQIPAIVQAVQGDTGRDVIFELADYEIPAGATANYYIDKPDDTVIYNSAEVISSTEILAHLTEQALAAPGRNNGQVRILSDGEVITSFDFVLEVEPFYGILRLQSETEINIFDQAIEDAVNAATEEAVAEIQAQTPVVTGMQNSIAPTYSASSTYAVGDYVMYNAQLYRCITAITTAEAWTGAHWTQVPLGSDVTDLKGAIDALPFEINEEAISISWTLIDKYRVSNGTYIDSPWFYECRISVNEGETYFVTGKSYYEMCVYYVEDSEGDIVSETHFSGESTLHENMKVTIPADGITLVLQTMASDRDTYQLKKYLGMKLDDESVAYETLNQNLQESLPADYFSNLYNPLDADIITGKYINSDGSLTDTSRMQVSGYIPVEYGKTYAFPAYTNFFGDTTPKYVCAYDANKTFKWAITGTVDTTAKITTFTVADQSLKYVRVNVASQGSNAGNTPHLNGACFMFTESPYPNHYVPYGEAKIFGNEVQLSFANEQKTNPLIGKIAVFTGDSICNGASADDGLDGWAGRIGKANNMLWGNKGISGATFTAGLSGSYGVISETSFDNADYLIIEGGTNDADLIGDARTTHPEAFGSYDAGDYTSTFENTTYCGAIEYLFKRIVNDYKDKKIGVIIAPKMGQLSANTPDYTYEHNNRRYYFQTLINLCEKWGIPYLNLWDNSIFNPMIASQYEYGQASADGKFYVDGQHLTSDGYNAIYTIIENWMKTL